MHVHDQVLAFLKTIGPTTPTKVSKTINSDIIIASAHLSDLASQGKVRISSLKLGGSPLYYLPGQEAQLYNFAESNLNPKDFAVLERLKNDGVLRESTLDLLSKVALRSLKDFAVPLQVRTAENAELFWKWHLLPDDVTNQIVRDILYPPRDEKAIVAEKVEEAVTADSSVIVPITAAVKVDESVIKPLEAEKVAPPRPEEEKPALVLPPEQKVLSTLKKVKVKKQSSEEQSQTVLAEKEAVTMVKPKVVKKTSDGDAFLPAVERFFGELNIAIHEHEILRKNAEIDFLIKVPTVVGKMTYFCKAKKKARCDEKDISAAYVEAQSKKLPLLFLYSQELTKKAQEMLDAGNFENVVVKRVE